MLNFLQLHQELSFQEAVDRLGELARAEAPVKGNGKPAESNGRPPLPAGVDPTELLERVANLYHDNLGRNEKALDYLAGRNLADFDMFRTFRVGYCCGRRLAELAGEGDTRQALKALGLLNPRGRETLTGCVVVPLRDRQGRVRSFAGRRILPGSNPHRVLPGPRRGLFYPEAARGTFQVILVEGFLDALACYQAGFRHVLALGGVQGATEELIEHLVREGVQEVLLALDADRAGDEGSVTLAERLTGAGLRCRRLRLPEGTDPSSFFATQDDSKAVFRSLVAQAHPVGEPVGPPVGGGSGEAPAAGSDDEARLLAGELAYRARLVNKSQGKMRALVRLEVNGKTHRDTLDLNSYKSRRTFANRVADRFGFLLDEVEGHLEKLTHQLEALLEEKERAAEQPVETAEMTAAEREEALAFLCRGDLLEQVLADLEQLGYVGEQDAKLMVYLIATSRKLEKPLAGIIQSGSGAGKSFLTEMAEMLMPPEDVVLLSRVSALAIGYMVEKSLKHKLLILEERAGGEAADYQIRTLQSRRRLTQLVTIKDPSTGAMEARTYEVEGPIAYLETTTSTQLNPENTSRCFEIPLDESAAQTKRIHQRQREVRDLEGLFDQEMTRAICRRHHNAQRLLESVRVVIPYARLLEFPDRYLRTRRDNERFLSLIEVVAFLHQYQRERHSAVRDGQEVTYVQATVEDYALAYQLAQRVLGVSLDELSRWARELFEWLKVQAERVAGDRDLAAETVTWTRRDIRDALGWPDRRLRESLQELVDMEYLAQARGVPGNTFVYSLTPESGLAYRNGAGPGLLSPQELEERIRVSSSGPAGPG